MIISGHHCLRIAAQLLESKELAGGLCRRQSNLSRRRPKAICNGLQDVGQKGRLISTVLGPFWHRPRKKKRRIGFEHQVVERNPLDQFTQVGASAFITDPNGNPDMQAPVVP